MSVGTEENSIENLNGMKNADIEEAVKKSKEELFNLRFQAATSQLDNNSRLKAVKRDIARMYTVLRERELGISEEPAETVKPEKKKSKPAKAAKPADAETSEESAPKAEAAEKTEDAPKKKATSSKAKSTKSDDGKAKAPKKTTKAASTKAKAATDVVEEKTNGK
jgi:large subunit ribosomal protein L29